MRLLFDENLAPSLVWRLNDLFPESAHVTSLGLGSTLDERIWRFAKSELYTLVTKDKDLTALALVRGAPPKVILLKVGNATVKATEQVLRDKAILIGEFIRKSRRSLLILR